ncbi:hypothetical protein K431DRAFT_285591 [Polychaeton citri CBS 116435]|uniref:Uncharacterized protein n=1 Tax=Polychaeton citri CBS 116435 TaxID=1314669 RepID=A0A9P4Q949_9PEZI|nr:hypothetical protein K431DRAFT_285591 [Polychaeton citri CBS 116435]
MASSLLGHTPFIALFTGSITSRRLFGIINVLIVANHSREVLIGPQSQLPRPILLETRLARADQALTVAVSDRELARTLQGASYHAGRETWFWLTGHHVAGQVQRATGVGTQDSDMSSPHSVIGTRIDSL